MNGMTILWSLVGKLQMHNLGLITAKPLTPGVHYEAVHTLRNLQLSAPVLFKYVWPFSRYQDLKDYWYCETTDIQVLKNLFFWNLQFGYREYSRGPIFNQKGHTK